MIVGRILGNGTPLLTLKVFGRGGNEAEIEGVLDTGFDGFLCLPIPVAVSLGLELFNVTRAELADGTTLEHELVFAAQAEWDGEMREVEVLLTHSNDPLIGTAFLKGYKVQLDYKTYTVHIEKTP